MRRIKKVTIQVSPNFYNYVNEERRKRTIERTRKIGIDKPIGIAEMTELIAKDLGYNKFKGGIRIEQKRRRFR